MEILDYLREKFPCVETEVFFTDYAGEKYEEIPCGKMVRRAAEAEAVCLSCDGCSCEFPAGRPVPVIREKPFKYLSIVYSSYCRFNMNLRKKSGLTKQQMLQTFDNFVYADNDIRAVALLNAKKAVKNKTSLVIKGGTGSGKTHLAVAAALATIQKGEQAIFRTAADLMDELQESKFNGDYYGLMRMFKEVPCLVLDDLGEETPVLYQIVDYRYRNGLQTIITVREPNSPHILSRLLQDGELVSLAGLEDWRLK